MHTYHLRPTPAMVGLIDRVVRAEMHWDHTVSFLMEVDLTKVEELRSKLRDSEDWKPTYTAVVMKALALAMKKYPYANRRLVRRNWLPFLRPRYQQFLSTDIAVGVERVVPDAECVAFTDVVRDVAHMRLKDITNALRSMSKESGADNRQWREFQWIGTHLPAWLAQLVISIPVHFPHLWARYRGGSAIVSSAAKFGADAIVGTWHYPVGVSFGQVKQRPLVKNGRIMAVPTFLLYLNFDRRLMAGAPAAHFFQEIVDILQNAAFEEPNPAHAATQDALASREKRQPQPASI